MASSSLPLLGCRCCRELRRLSTPSGRPSSLRVVYRLRPLRLCNATTAATTAAAAANNNNNNKSNNANTLLRLRHHNPTHRRRRTPNASNVQRRQLTVSQPRSSANETKRTNERTNERTQQRNSLTHSLSLTHPPTSTASTPTHSKLAALSSQLSAPSPHTAPFSATTKMSTACIAYNNFQCHTG